MCAAFFKEADHLGRTAECAPARLCTGTPACLHVCLRQNAAPAPAHARCLVHAPRMQPHARNFGTPGSTQTYTCMRASPPAPAHACCQDDVHQKDPRSVTHLAAQRHTHMDKIATHTHGQISNTHTWTKIERLHRCRAPCCTRAQRHQQACKRAAPPHSTPKMHLSQDMPPTSALNSHDSSYPHPHPHLCCDAFGLHRIGPARACVQHLHE